MGISKPLIAVAVSAAAGIALHAAYKRFGGGGGGGGGGFWSYWKKILTKTEDKSLATRFAEPAYDTPVAWGPNGTADKLSVPSKANDFSLSSGDFPTLGSEKDNSGKSIEQHDHGSHVRPGSGAGRTAPTADRNAMAPADHKSGTVDTWTLEDMPDKEDLGSQPEIPVSVSVGTTVESKSGDNKQNKQSKPHGWKQRGPTDVHRDQGFQQDSKKNDHKSKSSFPEAPNDISIKQRDSSLLQKIEGLNAKVRTSDSKVDAEQKNRLLVSPNDHPTIAFGTISDTDLKSTTASVSSFSRHLHHGVRSRAEQHNKGRVNNQDTDGWRKRSQVLGSEVATSVSAEAVDNPEAMNTDESLAALADPADGQAQRARMRELVKQRTIQLQQKEEERIKEQKAKALAKLEELNRRTLAAGDGTEVEIEQTDRPASSKENRSSHWQPKPQAYKSGWSSGIHNASSEVRRVRPDEPAADFKDGRGAPHEGHHKYRRERQPASFRQQPHSLIEDEIPIEQQHGTTGFRKFGGQNNRSGSQDDRRKHNQHDASINRERQKHNLHYEYQPVGSNNNSSNKSNILDAPADGSGNAGPRYKERVSGAGQQSRRGGGNFYGRQ